MDFNGNSVMNLNVTNFMYPYPLTCKSLRKLSKCFKVFMAVQLQTFCTFIQDLVMFLVNSNFFVNICRFV